MSTKLGEDVIKMYEPFRNHSADWKTTVISKQKFEIEGRYEIIDVSKIFAYGSWAGRIWDRCSCQR